MSLQVEYGNDVWLSLLEKAGYQNTTFCTHSIYPEVISRKQNKERWHLAFCLFPQIPILTMNVSVTRNWL